MTTLNHRRLCSHDVVLVPENCYVLVESGGEMYFCNGRCLCLWAVQFVTKVERSEEDKTIPVEMTTPNGAKRRFQHLLEMAQWAAANALKGVNNEWMNNGEAVS
jgi:hypothetical protein